MPGGNPRWVKGGPSPNPKGRPKGPQALTEIIRRTADKEAMVANLQRLALGQPMYHYRDASGKTCCTGSAPPEGATDIREVYPSDGDQLRALELIWNRLEPQTKKVDVTVSRGLDQQSSYDLARLDPGKLDRFIELTGELAGGGDEDADAEDAELVDED